MLSLTCLVLHPIGEGSAVFRHSTQSLEQADCTLVATTKGLDESTGRSSIGLTRIHDIHTAR